jgi:hypothetical protein
VLRRFIKPNRVYSYKNEKTIKKKKNSTCSYDFFFFHLKTRVKTKLSVMPFKMVGGYWVGLRGDPF